MDKEQMTPDAALDAAMDTIGDFDDVAEMDTVVEEEYGADQIQVLEGLTF